MNKVSEEAQLLKEYIDECKHSAFLREIKRMLLATDIFKEIELRRIINVVIKKIDRKLKRIG